MADERLRTKWDRFCLLAEKLAWVLVVVGIVAWLFSLRLVWRAWQ